MNISEEWLISKSQFNRESAQKLEGQACWKEAAFVYSKINDKDNETTCILLHCNRTAFNATRKGDKPPYEIATLFDDVERESFRMAVCQDLKELT